MPPVLRWLHPWLPAALLTGILTFLLYRSVLPAFFILDDFVWLESAQNGLASPATLFNRGISNFFRPVAHLHFALVHALAGLSPVAYRVSTLLLHALCAGLLAQLVFRLSGRTLPAMAGALLFALLPSYTEVMVWISAVTEPLYVALCLLNLLAWLAVLQRPRCWLGAYLLAFICFLLALAAKEAAVSLLPLMVLMHLGLRVAGKPIQARTLLYLPFVLLLAGYLHFQLETQQVSYLVRSGMYAFGLHFVPLSVGCLLGQLAHGWPALVAAAVGGGLLLAKQSPPGRTLVRVGCLVGLLLLAYLAVMTPYAMFTGNVLASRYFYFPSLLLCLGLGLAWIPLAQPVVPRSVRFTVISLSLGVMLFGSVRASQAEVRRYHSAARTTQRFLDAARRLPTAKRTVTLLDGTLVDQQLQAAFKLFHGGRKLKVRAVERRQLPNKWKKGEVWAWDPVSETFREVPPVD